jgi:protein-S-isoprenylcysteine O-methyltransferase Ste14
VVGVAMRALGKRTLGEYYAYGLRILPNHKLVKSGIYGHIRHPITLAAIIYSVGIPLFFSSLYGFIVMLTMMPFFLYRIEIEEKMLLERFGDEYREYMKHTKKIIPCIY